MSMPIYLIGIYFFNGWNFQRIVRNRKNKKFSNLTVSELGLPILRAFNTPAGKAVRGQDISKNIEEDGGEEQQNRSASIRDNGMTDSAEPHARGL